jgi:hypothetical protein
MLSSLPHRRARFAVCGLAKNADQRLGLCVYALNSRAPAVSDPALRQMVRPIVQHVSTLTERAQIP